MLLGPTEIRAKTDVRELDAVVVYRYRLFPLECKTTLGELVSQRGLINRFEKPRAQDAVNSECVTQYHLGKLIFFHN